MITPASFCAKKIIESPPDIIRGNTVTVLTLPHIACVVGDNKTRFKIRIRKNLSNASLSQAATKFFANYFYIP